MQHSSPQPDVVTAYHADRKAGFDHETALQLAQDKFRLKRKTVQRYLSQAKQGKLAPAPVTGIPNRVDIMEHRIRDLERQLVQAQKENIKASQVREYIFELPAHNPEPREWQLCKGWKDDKSPGVPQLFLSDLHIGETVIKEQVYSLNAFDMDIAWQRLNHTVETAAYLLEHHIAPHNYNGIVVNLGGDMVSGEIHEDLATTNQRALMPMVLETADMLVQSLQVLAEHFGKVHIYGVSGNHGRSTRKPRLKFYAETNFDWLIYQMIERILRADKRFTFYFPPARDITFEVAGRRYRLIHGDQFRGGDSLIGAIGPVKRGDKRKRGSGVVNAAPQHRYDTLLLGHWHYYWASPEIIQNGSLKGYDEYAVDHDFDYQPPIQACWTTHPRYGCNYIMPIYCDPAFTQETVH